MVVIQTANRQWSFSLGKIPHHEYHYVTKRYTGLWTLAQLFWNNLSIGVLWRTREMPTGF
jgi:hypothetical protein